MRIHEIDTPALLVDLDAMESNLHRMAGFFQGQSTKLRPHFKNHKAPKGRTMDFNANDVGFVPAMAGHSIENTSTEDLVFLEMFRTARYQDISLNQWIARLPDKMAEAHLKLAARAIRSAPQDKHDILPA